MGVVVHQLVEAKSKDSRTTTRCGKKLQRPAGQLPPNVTGWSCDTTCPLCLSDHP